MKFEPERVRKKKLLILSMVLAIIGILLLAGCRPPELEGVKINMNQGMYDKAYELAKSSQFGQMAALHGSKVVRDFVRVHRKEVRIFFFPDMPQNTIRMSRFGMKSKSSELENSQCRISWN